MKHVEIYTELKDRILRSVIAPGEKLPAEPELAERFHAARNTLRRALDKLEREGYLTRAKSLGTFVKEREIPADEKVISFLVPYPGYLIQRLTDGIFANYTNFLYGAIRAASEAGWRIQTVPFSQVNDPKEIDWQALGCLRAGSRLLIFNFWYRNAFDFFEKRGVRCGIFMESDSAADFPWRGFLEKNVVAWLPYEKVFGGALETMVRRGCRRILLAGPWLHSVNVRTFVYRRVMRRLGLEEFLLDLVPDRSLSYEDAVSRIREACRKVGPDAVFLCPSVNIRDRIDSLYRDLDLAKGVRLVLHCDDAAYTGVRPAFSAFLYHTETAGYELARRLMDPVWKPGSLLTPMDFLERESSLLPGDRAVSPVYERTACPVCSPQPIMI